MMTEWLTQGIVVGLLIVALRYIAGLIGWGANVAVIAGGIICALLLIDPIKMSNYEAVITFIVGLILGSIIGSAAITLFRRAP